VIVLALISVAYGLFTYILFHRLTDHKALQRITSRMVAHIIAFRLFVDEPQLVLKEQLELLLDNARLLRVLALPVLMAALVFGCSYNAMEQHFGRRPLSAGERAVVTLPSGAGLKPSPAFEVETPPVRVLRLNQISWRIRVVKPGPQFTRPVNLSGFPWQAWFFLISAAAGFIAATLHSRARQI
jgi:hypothetical protein